MCRYMAYAAIAIALLTLIVWAVSQFVQPILPPNFNSVLVLFFVALLGVAGFISQFKDAVEFFQFLHKPPHSARESRRGSRILAGPIQLSYGNITNVTVNVTYISNSTNAVTFAPQVISQKVFHTREATIPREAPTVPPNLVGRYAEVMFVKKALLQCARKSCQECHSEGASRPARDARNLGLEMLWPAARASA